MTFKRLVYLQFSLSCTMDRPLPVSIRTIHLLYVIYELYFIRFAKDFCERDPKIRRASGVMNAFIRTDVNLSNVSKNILDILSHRRGRILQINLKVRTAGSNSAANATCLNKWECGALSPSLKDGTQACVQVPSCHVVSTSHLVQPLWKPAYVRSTQVQSVQVCFISYKQALTGRGHYPSSPGRSR